MFLTLCVLTRASPTSDQGSFLQSARKALRVFPDIGTPDRAASSGIEQWSAGEAGAMQCQGARNLA